MRRYPKYKRKEYMEKLYEIINKLLELKDHIFIVEGKKDIESLMFLGISKKQIYAVSNKEISKILCAVQGKKLIDFLDNDKEGINIKENLLRHNIYVDSKYKNDLFKLLQITKTEEIKRRIMKLRLF